MRAGKTESTQELLGLFSAEAQDCAAHALERDMQEGFRPELSGKSLSDVTIRFTRKAQHPSDPRLTDFRSITVSPLGPEAVQELEMDGLLNTLEPDEKVKYSRMAKALRKLQLSRYFSADELPSEETWAKPEYNAISPDGYTAYMKPRSFRGIFARSVGRAVIAEGRDLVDDAFNHISSDQFFGYQDTSDSVVKVEHYYRFNMTPTLSLNGSEDRGFLVNYRDAMEQQFKEVLDKATVCGKLGIAESQEAVDSYLAEAEIIKDALIRVSRFV